MLYLKKIAKKLYKLIMNLVNTWLVFGKPKIFCIGLNKTGTTSLHQALLDLNVIVANEDDAKPLFDSWAKRCFKPIFRFCYRAQAFQDLPFSLPYTFMALDQRFSNCKFILTVRDSDEQWYRSITKFHSKIWAKNDGIPPNKEQLLNAVSFYKGRPWHVNRILFNTPEDEPYNKAVLLDFYNTYNKSVVDYFKTRPEKLLVINLSDEDAYQKFIHFTEFKSKFSQFPWKNKTES